MCWGGLVWGKASSVECFEQTSSRISYQRHPRSISKDNGDIRYFKYNCSSARARISWSKCVREFKMYRQPKRSQMQSVYLC